MVKLKLCRGSIGIRHLYGMWSSEFNITPRPFLPREETPMQCKLSGRFVHVEGEKLSFLQEFEPCTVQPVA